MLYRCGRAGSVTALWFVQRMLQGSKEKRKGDSLISMQECQTARACPSHHWILPCGDRDLWVQNKAGVSPLTLQKEKEQKACCLLPAPLGHPCCVGNKSWLQIGTVVTTDIFKIAICKWLINAAWVQTVLLIKLRGTFQKQYWWVLHCAGRAEHGCLSPPETGKTNKQVKYRPEQNGS